MKQIITPKQIKTNNRQIIYTYIYQNKKVTQQDISYSLKLSRPTVTSNLVELEEEGLIMKNGQIDSETIGRKPVAYSVNPQFRVGIGVEITRSAVKVMAVDLYGQKITRNVLDIEFELQDHYFQRTSEFIQSIIHALLLSKEQILGIGFAMQGLTSEDGTTLVYGQILNNSGLSIDMFSRYLDYPCSFIHDAESAAISELWGSPELDNAFFLLLSYHVGAAFIANRSVVTGKHGHCGTPEHIVYDPNGPRCYCGKQGCLETYLSMTALLGEQDPEAFFDAARNRDGAEAAKWREYLKILAQMINTLHLVYDVDYVISGYLAQYITREDILFIYEEIEKLCSYTEDYDYITVAKMPKHSITMGAALPYIRQFLENIDVDRAK